MKKFRSKAEVKRYYYNHINKVTDNPTHRIVLKAIFDETNKTRSLRDWQGCLNTIDILEKKA